MLDCCLPSYDGNKDFKGRYTFPETLVNRTSIMQCKYNPAELSRRCVSDMEIGPSWGIANLDNCDARYTTTNNLLKLNQVNFLYIFSICKLLMYTDLSRFDYGANYTRKSGLVTWFTNVTNLSIN